MPSGALRVHAKRREAIKAVKFESILYMWRGRDGSLRWLRALAPCVLGPAAGCGKRGRSPCDRFLRFVPRKRGLWDRGCLVSAGWGATLPLPGRLGCESSRFETRKCASWGLASGLEGDSQGPRIGPVPQTAFSWQKMRFLIAGLRGDSCPGKSRTRAQADVRSWDWRQGPRHVAGPGWLGSVPVALAAGTVKGAGAQRGYGARGGHISRAAKKARAAGRPAARANEVCACAGKLAGRAL